MNLRVLIVKNSIFSRNKVGSTKMSTSRAEQVEEIENDLWEAEYRDDLVSEQICELDDFCCDIMARIFALQGVVISYDTAYEILYARGNNHVFSYRRFLSNAPRLMKCNQTQLLKFINAGKETAISWGDLY
jgi:hypothetical protein